MHRNVIFQNMHIMLVNIAKLRTVAPSDKMLLTIL